MIHCGKNPLISLELYGNPKSPSIEYRPTRQLQIFPAANQLELGAKNTTYYHCHLVINRKRCEQAKYNANYTINK